MSSEYRLKPVFCMLVFIHLMEIDSLFPADPEKAISPTQRAWLEPYGRAVAVWAWPFYIMNRILMRFMFRLRVIGRGHLPKTGPFILTPNHTSHLDAPALAAALSHRLLSQTRWLARSDVIFSSPFLRLICRLAQAIPVEEDPEHTGSFNLAAAALSIRQGKNLIWFPEGHRSKDGRLQPFKTGVGVILEHFRIPAIPVRITGAYEALPPDRRFPRFRKITVEFGEPVDAATLEKEGPGNSAAQRVAQALQRRVAG